MLRLGSLEVANRIRRPPPAEGPAGLENEVFREIFHAGENKALFPFLRPIHVRQALAERRLIVATQNHLTVGALSFRRYKRPRRGSFGAKGDLLIETLAVRPGFRRQGVGTQLVTELEHLARATGAGGIVLAVLEHNLQARRFFRSIGMEEAGKIHWTRADGSRLPGLCMRKSLKA